MKPKRIIIIRHAESEGNVNRITHATVPDWKIPLTEKGLLHANEVGAKLKKMINGKIAFYTSSFARTTQTLGQLKLHFSENDIYCVKEDPRLMEQSWGNLRAYEPTKWADIEAERDHYGPFFYRFLHGEGGVEVYQRCSTFLDTLYRDFEKQDFPDNVVIVTHGFTLRILLMRWMHWSVEEFHSLKNPKNLDIFELKLGEDDKYFLTEPFPKHEK